MQSIKKLLLISLILSLTAVPVQAGKSKDKEEHLSRGDIAAIFSSLLVCGYASSKIVPEASAAMKDFFKTAIQRVKTKLKCSPQAKTRAGKEFEDVTAKSLATLVGVAGTWGLLRLTNPLYDNYPVLKKVL
jgi:hypothetical protein